jgi:hypothetical protein
MHHGIRDVFLYRFYDGCVHTGLCRSLFGVEIARINRHGRKLDWKHYRLAARRRDYDVVDTIS